jgi:hypothetical protein
LNGAISPSFWAAQTMYVGVVTEPAKDTVSTPRQGELIPLNRSCKTTHSEAWGLSNPGAPNEYLPRHPPSA